MAHLDKAIWKAPPVHNNFQTLNRLHYARPHIAGQADSRLSGAVCKEYTDDDGKVSKIVEWFGYKLHLLVDAKHEVSLAYQVTAANAADCKSLPDLVGQGQANLAEGRIQTLAYNKAADDNESHRLLNKAKIRPVIQNRHSWKEQSEQMLPGHHGRSNVVYDEAGSLHSYDRTSLTATVEC
jgi:hypothetical protein